MNSFLSSAFCLFFFEIHHILHVSVVYSFLYICYELVLNDNSDREREICITGKGSGLGQS